MVFPFLPSNNNLLNKHGIGLIFNIVNTVNIKCWLVV